MIRIGVVNIDTSHPMGFAECMKAENRARYTAVYNDGFRGDDEVDAFIRKYQLEKRCKTLGELVDYVDIGFVQGCNWDKHLEYARPFIERGKPVFIDKPMVGSLKDCKALEKYAAEGRVILGSSSARYAEEIVNFLSIPESERGKIVNISGTSGVDEFNYGIHIVEAIGGLAGTGAVSTRFAGRAAVDGKVCDTFLVKYESGITAVYNTFQGAWMPFAITVMTTKTVYQFKIDSTKIYGALLKRIFDCMETGKNTLASIKEITESVKIMLAGRISKEDSGREVCLNSIPEDDSGYDGNVFEKGYAAASNKIYLG